MSNSICSKFENRLAELVESKEITLPRDLLEHAGRCESCRTLWEDLHGLDRAMKLWKEEPIRTELTEKILAGLVEDKSITENPPRRLEREKESRTIWYSAAVVIALLLIMSVTLQWNFKNRNGKKIEPVTKIARHEPLDEVSGELSDVVSQFRKTSLQFAVDASNSASQVTVLIPERTEWLPLGEKFTNLPENEKTVSTQLVEGFSPLGNRLDRAFQDLLESVSHETRTKPELE